MRPHPLDHIPTLEAAERFELSSSAVEARSIDPLCYTASFLLLVRDVGFEPTSSRLKGECISISANPANSGGRRWNRTSLVSIKSRVHLPSLPVTHVQHQNGAGCWNRTNASRLSTAGSTFELILPVRKLWCAVRELNPHLLGVGQLFWSVELPAQTW